MEEQTIPCWFPWEMEEQTIPCWFPWEMEEQTIPCWFPWEIEEVKIQCKLPGVAEKSNSILKEYSNSPVIGIKKKKKLDEELGSIKFYSDGV